MASLITGGKFQAIGSAGVALPAAKLYTYAAGTLTPQATYTDQGGLTPNTNPVVCDTAGQAAVWLGSAAYRMILKTSADVTVWDTDNISGFAALSDFINTASTTLGDALVGVKHTSSGAVARTQHDKNKDVVTFADFGADPTGAADSATAIQNAVSSSLNVRAGPGTFKISSTVTLPAGLHLDLGGANITANTGSTPLFQFTGAGEGLYIKQGGGQINGTADSVLFCQGSTNTPTTTGQYARQIRLEGVHASSTTITKFLDFDKAVRQVFLSKCYAYTVNGWNVSGKCVEVFATKSVFYSSTGAAGTYGLKLRSPGATTYYNEGFHFTDCLIDNFDKSYDVQDVFVLTVDGGYVSAAAGGYALDVGQPTTTTCRKIQFRPAVCGAKIRFAPTGGYDYSSDVKTRMTGVTGANVQLANNACGVTIDVDGDTSTSGVLVEMVANNANCTVIRGSADSTFIGGVQVKGASGAGVSVGPLNYAGTGDSIYAERAVLLLGLPISTTNTATYKATYNAGDLATNYAVGVDISSQSVTCAKGETGDVDISLYCTGMNATTQRFDITLPTGMSLRSGTGWSAAVHYPFTATGAVCKRIPYYCTADINAGTLKITNGAGNTVTVNSHSYFGLVKDM